ncbi:MAG: choice-of-anchor Q domain-containing protein, partial [Candidatus Berkiella sp.]
AEVLVTDIVGVKLVIGRDAYENGAIYVDFTFQVKDNGGVLNSGVDTDQSANQMQIDVTSVNDEPSGADKTVYILENGSHTFSASDFGFSDVNDTPANAFNGLFVKSLPDNGYFSIDGVGVELEQFISNADIAAGKFVFSPVEDEFENNYASFTFAVKDDGGTANSGEDTDQSPNTVTVNVIECLMPTIFTDENSFGTGYAFGSTSFSDAYAKALSGDGLSLREAVILANHYDLPGDDTICLSDGTYYLTIAGNDENGALTGDLDIMGSVIIQNVEGGTSVIDASDDDFTDRVFDVQGFGTKLELNSITIQGAHTTGFGAGILGSYDTEVDINNVNINNNQTTTNGGAIYFIGSALTITDSEIMYNKASSEGGGLTIYGIGVTATINSSTIAYNEAVLGGGIIAGGGSLTVNTSTISSNTATSQGGGLRLEGEIVQINNSTITENTVTSGAGGGIYHVEAASIIGSLNLYSSIVAQNTDDKDIFDSLTVSISDGYNLIGNGDDLGAGFTAATGDQIGTAAMPIDAKLGPLDYYNGGSTQTHSLLDGSPAIDAGDPLDTTGLDQNGLAPSGTRDIGAFEYQVPPVFLDLNNDGIHLISAQSSPVLLALDPAKADVTQVGWVTPDDGVLVFNYAGESTLRLDQISFTSYTPGAKTDLEGLIAFDSNHDGVLGQNDANYSKFGVWQDANNNGIIDNNEFQTLAQRAITAISLTSDHQQQIQNGNIIHGLTTYETQDGQSHVAADVSLALGQTTKAEALQTADVITTPDQVNLNTVVSQNNTVAPVPAQGLSAPAATEPASDGGHTAPIVVEHIIPPVQEVHS